jgi:hypothetical protein
MNEQLHGLEKALVLTNAYAISRDVVEEQERHRAACHVEYTKPAEDAGFLVGIAAEAAVGYFCVDQAIQGNRAPLYIYGGLKIITHGAALVRRMAEGLVSSGLDLFISGEGHLSEDGE